ncbi:hypothetical protein MATL_G00240270 [Megalops atlanticus]|uniref:Carboxypeptidase N subunit 2 n=1 Tax=Megalops atlanticus TaxID=7932 RepID=A0A9D3SXD2_MEGAT|nr:hypothetical protein MATL_G00240270 [Megalops atlanticus]
METSFWFQLRQSESSCFGKSAGLDIRIAKNQHYRVSLTKQVHPGQKMMSRRFCAALLVLLQLCYHGDSCPARCQCFTPARVFCSDERLTEVPRNLSSEVRELVIMTTGIMYVRPSDFSEGSRLTKLVFLNNLLQGVSRVAFDKLSHLTELEISGNHKLAELGSGCLKELGNLTTLLLNHNHFHTLGSGMFNALRKLETLQLKGNVIFSLPGDLFQHLQRLRLLDLSLNMISSVGRPLFRGLGQLETLRLSYNVISDLSPDAFDGMPRLRELYLQGNKITEIPPTLLSRLDHLRELNLRGNAIKGLAAVTFPSNLRKLNLEDNQISRLSPATSQRLPLLSQLFLSKNQLSVLPEDVFENLTALEHLDLAENLITTLPKAIFTGLSKLTVLHLQKNNISSLEGLSFEEQDEMDQLYLFDNALQSVPEGFFDPFLAHNIIRLHGNPWVCDCRLLYLHDWLSFGSQTVQEVPKMLCEAPAMLRGQGVLSLKREQLTCVGNSSYALTATPARSEHRPERTPPSGTCVVQETDGVISVQCTLTNFSQAKLEVQYRDEAGDRISVALAHECPESTQCINATATLTL